jgi:hypothetical protein
MLKGYIEIVWICSVTERVSEKAIQQHEYAGRTEGTGGV